MCGVSGLINWRQSPFDSIVMVRKMVDSLSHRGPDGRGIYADDWAALGHARLSIIDPQGGQQPLSNEDGSLWLVCNGEIYNYIELRAELEKDGHRFTTRTDVEVLLHLFEDYGAELLEHINGQYAFAIWDKRQRRMFLARDHVGICPLYYWSDGAQFVFASEIKALFQVAHIPRTLNSHALAQTFTFWSPLPGTTPFQDIHEIKPGCYLWVKDRNLSEHRYWSFGNFVEAEQTIHDPQVAIMAIRSVLEDAVRLRLRSDVPVGAYLSGGLDSSITTALIKTKNDNRLQTFSIGFESKHYDETEFQQQVSQHLNTDHASFRCDNKMVAEHLAEVVWHAEKPLLRTAPVPLFLLSKLVRDSGYKVVLTGEGADEYFSGYNIYKETKLRLFNAQQPASKWRPLLFKRLYPYLDTKDDRNAFFWRQFFQKNMLDTADPFYSHRIRWQNSAFILQFLSPEIHNQLLNYDPIAELAQQLNGDLQRHTPLGRAHLLETYVFLGSYLLCSQGDRMLMSHGVEGRYPFLDRRVIELANRLSPVLKLKGLNEKWILKKAFGQLLPPAVVKRSKQPYRAPIKDMFVADKDRFDHYLLDVDQKNSVLFAGNKVSILRKKFVDQDTPVSAREEMALLAVITTGMLHEQFIRNSVRPSQTSRRGWRIVDHRTNGQENQAVGEIRHAVA